VGKKNASLGDKRETRVRRRESRGRNRLRKQLVTGSIGEYKKEGRASGPKGKPQKDRIGKDIHFIVGNYALKR